MNNEIYNNLPYPDMNIINEMFMNNKSNSNYELTGPYEGYLKGNMFKNLYKGYKNYNIAKLIPNNEEAEILLNLNQLSFALNDIKLYLDIHPEDKDMINIFNKYSIELKQLLNNYESKYGPIMCDTPSNDNLFSWEAYSFPWEMEEM